MLFFYHVNNVAVVIDCVLCTAGCFLFTFGSRIDALSVLYGALEHVGELGLVAEEVGPDKVHHAPVLHQVVLQRIPCSTVIVVI